MKTTLDLPDDLMRAVNVRAAEQDLRLKDLIGSLLRLGLGLEPTTAAPPRSRVKLPLIECARAAKPEAEMTPDRVAAVLLDQEAEASLVPLRQQCVVGAGAFETRAPRVGEQLACDG